MEIFNTNCIECGASLTIIRDNNNTKEYYCSKCKLKHHDKFKRIYR